MSGSRILVAAVSALAIAVASLPWRPAIADDMEAAFDRVWRHATLYESPDESGLEKLSLSGRLQADGAWFDADQGSFSDAFEWRRFRFGFKSRFLGEWGIDLEADIDLNESLGNMYQRLTDAYLLWKPSDDLQLKFLKQSVGFTLDGATSSTKLVTMQRNNLSNNLWFPEEYFSGVGARGGLSERWYYRAGVYSSDGASEIGFDAGWFTLLSLARDIEASPAVDEGRIRIDYVYNDVDPDGATRPFTHVISLVSTWRFGAWGLRTDLSAGDGSGSQSDVWGFVIMPTYDFNPRIQTVLRYTFLDSVDDNGLRLTRYANRIVSGRGDRYNELYAGLNVYFYGHKLKWQTGLEYDDMRDAAKDGGTYRGWGLSTGFRTYW